MASFIAVKMELIQRRVGPMKEKDWDYVFQANKILHCSLVNAKTRRMERASHAAFRLKTSNEDDAEAELPQDDERAKIPVWTLASEPSRAYIRETNNELETSAMMSGHSKKSFNIGVFDDLMEFFDKYGTVYANKVVLGGRLINTKLFYAETMSETTERQEDIKNGASGSIGIDSFSIKGGYSDEHGTQKKDQKKKETDQTKIDWTGYGGNAALVSDPAKWLPTVPEYRNWKVIENAEVEPIQDFIGSLPGYDDIPGLFRVILASGLYSPEIIHLGPRLQLPGQKPKSDDLEKADIGAAVNILAIPTETPMNHPFASKSGLDTSSKTLAKGGVSWQVLDSQEAVRLEVSSVMESLVNIGANRSAIPNHLYYLSLRPSTISVVLRWSSDLVEKGLNLDFPGADQMGKTYRTLNQLAPEQCAKVVKAADELSTTEETKKAFVTSLDDLINVTEYSSLARFRANAWKEYLTKRLGTNSGTQEVLDTVKTEAKLMPNEDLGQDLSSKSPFTISNGNKALLKGNDINQCLAAMGHGFIESYTEKASMTAVWTLTLPDAPNHESSNTSDENFYAFRMAIQKYFFQPREIPEVCEFFSLRDSIFNPAPEVKVSIFGYCDRTANAPQDILNKAASVASSYLKPRILARNTERQTIRIKPWKSLHINDLPDSSQLKNMTVPELDEFFVLNVQRAARLLLLLLLYSDDPNSGIDKSKLEQLGKDLDQVLLEPGCLDSTGKMSQGRRDSLLTLVNNLEKTLPEGDPERDPK
ncbi:MAG: hypothetical protein Q9195_005164 [Heterodermia aff. obscurata]